MYRISLLAVVLLTCVCAVPAVAQDVRLAYLFSDGNLPGMLAAYKALREERPDLRDRVTVEFLTESLFDEVEPGGDPDDAPGPPGPGDPGHASHRQHVGPERPAWG